MQRRVSKKGASGDAIEQKILVVRGQKVMLDSDLAELYGVETKALNQAVMRNRERFPSDFMFQVSLQEFVQLQEVTGLRSQIVTSNERGGRRYRPYVFTEQGVAMLSSVLRSKRAIQANIAIMRTFVQLRKMVASHGELVRRLDALEKKYDVQFKAVFEAIRRLMEPSAPPESPAPTERRIGFHVR